MIEEKVLVTDQMGRSFPSRREMRTEVDGFEEPTMIVSALKPRRRRTWTMKRGKRKGTEWKRSKCKSSSEWRRQGRRESAMVNV